MLLKRARPSSLPGLLLILGVTVAAAPQKPLRPPDVPFEPSPTAVVEKMLALAGVGKDDVVYDLGCGDGRIVIAAARRFGARAVGIDIDPERIKESVENARAAGVADRVSFRNQDLFEADISKATVVTLFLWPEVNLKLRPKLQRELRPGTRVVSYYWTMGDWVPQKQIEAEGHGIYLWTIPPGPLSGRVPSGSQASSSRPGGGDFDEVRVTDRVLVLRHAPWAETMTVVDAGASLLVVDTWGSLKAAATARTYIEGVFHKPVRFVINTHHHWDHTFGNAAFRGAEIVGHRYCAEDLLADYRDPVARKRYFDENGSQAGAAPLREYLLGAGRETSEPSFRLAPPTRLTGERDVVRAGNLAVHLYHTPGIHTRSNLTVFVPELGILLGRSEFANPAQLKLESGADPSKIVAVLEAVLSAGRPVRYLIPGHGAPVENPDLRAAVERLRSMK